MRFVTWLWEQLDAPGDIGVCANICWKDVNNGCATPRFSASQWVAHFEERHHDRKDLLINMLVEAYKEYMLSPSQK